MVLRPVQAHYRLSLLRHSPVLCYSRRKYFLVSVTMGDVVLAKLCLKINPDSLVLLLLICTEPRPLERRSKRTAGDLLCIGEILSYRKLWCCQFCVSYCSSDVASRRGAEVYDSLTNPSLYNDSWLVMGMSFMSSWLDSKLGRMVPSSRAKCNDSTQADQILRQVLLRDAWVNVVHKLILVLST